MHKKWWKESVVYQVYPRSFYDSNGDGIGDLQGITQKLDYLNELGIDVIWLSPVYKSPNDDNGYDISDYQGIMDDFGTLEDFEQLLEGAHQRGIKIMMDLVVNHTSDEHPWFIASRSSQDHEKRDFYIWKQPKEDGSEPTNWGAAFGGSAWEFDERTGEYYLHLFSVKQPDLNWENPKLRAEIYNMMRWWLDKGVDGFRMDVINFISKDQRYPDGQVKAGHKYTDGGPYFLNGPRIHEFLQEMNKEVLTHYDTITVGEMPGVTPEQGKLYTGEERNELNMVFHFEHVSLGDGSYGKWSPGPWKLTELKRIFSKWQKKLGNEGWNSLYWSNHDQPRAVSRFGNDHPEYREISAKMLATCLHMMKGTPYIYQGEEIGMTNVAFESLNDYRDIETLNAYRDLVESGQYSHEKMLDAIHQRGRDNARTPMQWSNAANAGFTPGSPWIQVNPNYKEINAEYAVQNSSSIFHYYKKLIQLRKQHDIVVYGNYQDILDDDEQIFAYLRHYEEQTLLVVLNFGQEPIRFELPENITYREKQLLISNYTVDHNEGIQQFELRPYEARVYLLR